MADLSKNDVATKNDLENLKKELLGILVSKKDFKEQSDLLATKAEFKQELAKLVTKEEFRQELAKLVTKEEFKQELAKVSTKESVEVVARQVLKNTNDIASLRTEMRMGFNRVDDRLDSLESKFDIMMSIIDGIAKQLQNSRTEKAAIDHALTRHEDKLDSHEVRITHLEQQIA